MEIGQEFSLHTPSDKLYSPNEYYKVCKIIEESLAKHFSVPVTDTHWVGFTGYIDIEGISYRLEIHAADTRSLEEDGYLPEKCFFKVISPDSTNNDWRKYL